VRFRQLSANFAPREIITMDIKFELSRRAIGAISPAIVKHEISMAYIRDDTVSSSTELIQVEVMIEESLKKIEHSKITKAGTRAVSEVLYRERQSDSLVPDERKMRRETRLDELTRECSALRRRLEEKK
jgi:nucleoprotein TPR